MSQPLTELSSRFPSLGHGFDPRSPLPQKIEQNPPVFGAKRETSPMPLPSSPVPRAPGQKLAEKLATDSLVTLAPMRFKNTANNWRGFRTTLIVCCVLGLLTAACGSSPTAPTPPAPTPTPTPTGPTRDQLQFNLTFWNEFVHNAYDAPGALQPLRRWTVPPMIYLKTVDEAGVAMDEPTLSTITAAFQSVALTWGGGQFGLAGIQRGTGTMEGVAGWVTVKFSNPTNTVGGTCGQSTVGTSGGYIRFNYLNTAANCGCGGPSTVNPRLARHELGHAFGYWHTDNMADVMWGGDISPALCDAMPSPREVYHATVAYQSQPGITN